MERPAVLLGLDEAEIGSVVEAAVGEPIAEFAASAEGRPDADKCPVVFSCVTAEGRSREVRLFVKRCAWKGRGESVHYRFLARQGVPTAALHGALKNADGDEVIFLEHLRFTGFREDSEAEWRAMLTLLARLNTCEVSPEYEPHLHAYEMVGAIDGAWWILGLPAEPSDSDLEAVLRAGGAADDADPELHRAARRLFERIAAHPRGLLHQDFLSDNLGWRGNREEMVVFDVHKNARGPRFADVAPYLALPDWSRRANFLETKTQCGETIRTTLTQHYLDEYARFGGEPASARDFHEEAGQLSWAHKLLALDWLAENGKHDRNREVFTFLHGMPD